ncbi:hypothetical protein BJF78_05630 [Pseudonocardia sp. CNS-139]|nr:hypothetical protein BJF78_05630 [Pseudonocardia sp. CNS-139]
MSTQFEYRSASSHPAADVYAAMVDPEYLRARLAQIGGPGAGLLEHTADADGARYRLRHGLDPEALPAVVRGVLPGDVVIERAESWKREGPGRYTGDVTVTIPGAPGSAAGVMRLNDLPAGSELDIRVDVTVKVPLVGGLIEGSVGNHVTGLLASEAEFTQRWLAQRQG